MMRIAIKSMPCLYLALPLALLQPVLASANDEPEPICTRAEVVDFVTIEIHRKSPYAVMQTDTIGERPSTTPTVVLCSVVVVQRDFDYVRYRTETWTEYQAYSVRKLTPGYVVTMHDPVRQ